MASIEKRGSTYRAIVRRKGFPVVRATFDTKAEALRWATLTERRLVEQRNAGGGQALADALKLSVADALKRYSEEVTPSKKGIDAQQTEKGRIRRLRSDPIGSLKMPDVRGRDVAALITRLQEAGQSANSIRLHLAILSHCFTVARTDWSLESLGNPVKNVRKPKIPAGRERRLVGNEESDLIEAAAVVNPELADIIIFAIETAARRGEIMNLAWERVDVDKHVVTLVDTKINSETRTAPLSERAEVALKRQEARIKKGLDEDEDMPERVWSYTAQGMYASYKLALGRAGITGLTFHDLRHESTSRLFERGLNPMVVQAITGHKTVQMLKRYTHLQTESLVAAVRGNP